jgi:3-deoxy-D-manno-octulosonate 8-phosphate phosphatase (KDO 8-P phosphatase)
MSDPTLAERVARVELLVLDADGVLTDGRIVYADDGAEIKSFHVRDGSALRLWADAGKRAAVISGRDSPAVTRRARELGVGHLFQGAGAKLEVLRRLLAETGLAAAQVCAVGDDLPDLPLLKNCGLGIAVADACPELRAAAHFITRARGGHGAVREVVELLMRGRGLWQPVLDRLAAERL